MESVLVQVLLSGFWSWGNCKVECPPGTVVVAAMRESSSTGQLCGVFFIPGLGFFDSGLSFPHSAESNALFTLMNFFAVSSATHSLCLQPGTLNFYLNSSRKTINKLVFKHDLKKLFS